MKDLVKDFVMRHPLLSGLLIFIFFWSLGVGLTFAYDNLWFFLFFIPALLGLIGLGIFQNKYEWVCPNCQHSDFLKREKYCGKCGTRMRIRKQIRTFKMCSSGHRIEEEGYKYKYCPKCGALLRDEN